jgi:hypothetical protein
MTFSWKLKMALLINAVLLVPYILFYLFNSEIDAKPSSLPLVFNLLGLTAAVILIFRKGKDASWKFYNLYLLLILTEFGILLITLILSKLFIQNDTTNPNSITFEADYIFILQFFLFFGLVLTFAVACIGWGIKKLFFN